MNKIPIGVSSCLLGREVRYDGGHKRDALICDTLSEYFELIPVCPEVAIGLGIPRGPVRLVAKDGGIRVLGVNDPDLDVTDLLTEYGRRMARQLADIRGYIFKARSPSCGVLEVVVHTPAGVPIAQSAGAFAAALMAERPDLPVEEENRLADPALRERFVDQVFAYHRRQARGSG